MESANFFLTKNFVSKSRMLLLNIKSDGQRIGEYILEKLSAELANKSSFDIVARRELDAIIREQQFNLSAEVSDESAVRIGQMLGAQIIISGSMIKKKNQYELFIKPISVETGKVLKTFTANVIRDSTLKGLEDDAVDEHYLYLGGRAGLSYGFYGNGRGLADNIIYPSQSISGIPSFDGALFFSVAIFRLFEIQTEAFITNDSFDLNAGNTKLFTVSYNSLMIPLLAKLVYRPSSFMIQGYAGGYLSIPLGQMNVKHKNGSYTADFSLVGGIMAGAEIGKKLGPGTLLLDLRYAADLANLIASHNGNKEISKRNKMSVSLGYEFGLISR